MLRMPHTTSVICLDQIFSLMKQIEQVAKDSVLAESIFENFVKYFAKWIHLTKNLKVTDLPNSL